MQTTELNQDEGHDEFEQAQEEVLTYILSEQIAASPPTKPSRARNTEKHKLELISLDKQVGREFNFKEINRNIKKMSDSHGKVIRIGSVTFRSNFECGNLNCVKLVAHNTYQIELEKETNSNRTSGWFYFNVEGIKGEASFIIRGFSKSSSLYNENMKVCYRDTKDVTKWRRGGTHISYTNSQDEQGEGTRGYQLRFSHFFKSNEVTCIEFASCFPYGLKKLSTLLNSIKETAEVKVLGRSFSNQNIPLLTIGNKQSEKVIVVSARVHPGETVSSFIMQGFIKELVGDNQYGKLLRSHFLFKIVPMVNPDGVARGNYRFSGYGCDLNRKWKSCKEQTQPQIFHLKELIRQMNRDKKVVMYIDMHGHSRKKNVFFYGCVDKTTLPSNSRPREFPYIMEKIHDAYQYDKCCFAIQKDKEGTARVAMWKELRIDYVYTLESSFCGSQYGANYLEADYQKIGKKLCEGITCLFYEEISAGNKSGQGQRVMEKLAVLKKRATDELIDNPQLLHVGDEDDSGSESEPELGQIPDKERNPQTGLPKPESLTREHKSEARANKIKISTKIQSQQTIRDQQATKIKSQIYAEQQFPKRWADLHPQSHKAANTIMIENDKFRSEKVEIKIANSVNTFELEALRASSLYHKNTRVHSITRNSLGPQQTERDKKVVNPFSQTGSQQERDGRLRINLIHGREGAQYRRVRKIAEESMKKEMVADHGKIVREVHAHNMNNHLDLQGGRHGIAPKFYPKSQQRTRKTSLESYIKRQPRLQQLKRISINGDDLNVRCLGKHVFL